MPGFTWQRQADTRLYPAERLMTTSSFNSPQDENALSNQRQNDYSSFPASHSNHRFSIESNSRPGDMDVEVANRSLLEQCDPLTNSERVARLVKLGVESRKNESAKAQISQLASGSVYEQLLSLETCYGSRDIGTAKQILATSFSKHLKKRAITLISLLGDDDELVQALESVPSYLQIQTLRRIRHTRRSRKRLDAIEKFLGRLEAKEDSGKQFRALFLLGSKAIVERNLPELLSQFSTLDWSNLAKYHPEMAQTTLSDWIERAEFDDDLLTDRVNSVLTQWLSHDYTINFAIELARKSVKKISLAWLPVKALMNRLPRETAEIVLSSEESVPKYEFEEWEYRALRKLPMSLFQPLFERYPAIVEQWEFFAFTLEQRRLAYSKFREEWREKDGTLENAVLEKLPTVERVKEARRHLKLKRFETKPQGRIPYIALLPWDEAIELQTPFIRSGDATIRIAALTAQIRAARYDDARIIDAVKLVLTRKNEQDPVRAQLISALSDIPRGRWTETHLELLSEIIRNNLDSTDVGHGTLYSLMILVTNILSVHPKWASQQMGIIMRERDNVTFRFTLSGPVRIKDVMAVVSKELGTVLEKLVRKREISYLVTLEYLFHEYMKHWPEYLDTCEKVLEMPDIDIPLYGQLLDVLRKNRPESWSRVLPPLIRENTSIASDEKVVGHVNRRQQNLLDAYFLEAEEEPKERRNALKILHDGFWWWTPSQQTALAQILLKDIADEDTASEDKIACVKQLSMLTYVDHTHLLEIARSGEPAIQETALKALGHLDGNEGVPVLVEALSDERARIAIYALRHVLKTLPKDKVFELLNSVPQTKVTVGKETIRLIGELGTGEAFQFLLEKEKTDLHPDVRVALYRALWSYLDRDETWQMFNRAAQNSDPKIAKAACTIPDDGLAPQRKQSLLEVLLHLLNHDSAEVRIAALERCDTSPVQDPENILGPRLFELVFSDLDDECAGAAKAIFETYAKTSVEQVGKVYRKLLSHRKTLKRVHDTYMDTVSPYPGRKYLRPVTHLLLHIFKTDKLSITRRVKLMFEGLPWEELRPYLFEIMPELHADALHTAVNCIENNQSGWKEDSDDLLEAELEMKGSADERARRLAFSMLIGNKTGWTDEERERLEEYRADESVLVAEAAWEFTVPEKEDEDEDDKGDYGGKDDDRTGDEQEDNDAEDYEEFIQEGKD